MAFDGCEWLDRAYEARDEALYFLKGYPLFKNLEGDPSYKALLRKMTARVAALRSFPTD
jgi:hypothetical protein